MRDTTKEPELKHLVLLGGGHAQIAVLKSLVMSPISGLRVTLVSRDVMTPYSGMLPGYLEGYFRADDITIDLSHLARQAGARFIHAAATGIDPEAKVITLAGRPAMFYDVLSINIGSNPSLNMIEGAAQHAIPVKPISTLLDRISPVMDGDNSANYISIIGGGAAGVEVALSLNHFMQSQLRDVKITLIHRGASIMPEFPPRAARLLMAEMEEKGIEVITNAGATVISSDQVVLDDGRMIPSDQSLVVTAGKAPDFLKNTGLALDDNGFIAVGPSLQSTQYPDVFAAGDIATVTTAPRPKAGVFAVRAGAILTRNLRAYVVGAELTSWIPQRNYLALVGVGGGRALPIRGNIVLSPSAWAWRLKTWIDTRFIAKFSGLPEMTPPPPSPLAKSVVEDGPQNGAEGSNSADPALGAMRCLGCGAKTGWGDLTSALTAASAYLRNVAKVDVLDVDVTADAAMIDGAKIANMVGDGVMVQSVDAISALVDDPFMLGRIAALHALSDLHASNAAPHHGLAILTLPTALAALQKDDITQLLAGAMTAFHEEGAFIAGGHTAQADAMQVGFAVTGFTDGTPTYTPKDGDAVILTKPLGIGITLAGHNQGHALATGHMRDAAINVMSQSNGIAARVMQQFAPFPMTDVTGFGVLRHGLSLLASIGQGDGSLELFTTALPLIDGVKELAGDGVQSSITAQNKAAAPFVDLRDEDDDMPDAVLYDPQTGGGLMAVVPHEDVQAITAALNEAGCDAVHMGWFKDDGNAQVEVSTIW